MKNILELSRAELEKEMTGMAAKKFNAAQIMEWLYIKHAGAFEVMTNLPLSLRETLKKYFIIEYPSVEKKLVSAAKDTIKYLLKCSDGVLIESVLMKHIDRNTICLSSQAGCAYGCAMCATGSMGFKRNLSAAEITGQVFAALPDMDSGEYSGKFNVVFMGMGEPLANYDNFKKAAVLLTEKKAFGISPRRITVSTCGVVPGIENMIRDGLRFNLSVSLHAVNDRVRDMLVPVNKKYRLEKLFTACAKYFAFNPDPVTFEYVMIRNVNDRESDLNELIAIISDLRIDCKVNLIPYNRINIKEFSASAQTTIDEWRETLEKEGVICSVRREMGADINAACGQLAGGGA